MKLRPSILFIILFSPLVALTGQDTLLVNADLARKRLADSVKAAGYLDNAKKFFLSGTEDSAFSNISTSLDIASENNFILVEAGCYELKGTIYEKRSDMEGMLLNYLQASVSYNKVKELESEARVIRTLGDRYFDLGAYRKSAGYYEQEYSLYPAGNPAARAASAQKAALAWYYHPVDTLSVRWFNVASGLFEAASDNEGRLQCSEKLAKLYIRMSQYDKAMQEYDKLLRSYLDAGNNKQAATIYNNIGYLRFKLEDFDKAIKDFQSASEFSARAGNDPWFLTDVHNNLAIVCQRTGRDKEMMQYFTNALVYATRSKRFDEAARIDHILAIIYFRKGDNYHAELYCRECIETAKTSSALSIMQECYKTLSEVMEKGNDYPKALEYYEKYLNIRDSLNFEIRLAEKNEADRLTGYDRLEERLRLSIADQEIEGLAMKNLRAESARRENEVNLLLSQQKLDRSEKDRLAQSLALERERSQLTKREQDIILLKQGQERDSLRLKLQQEADSVLKQKNIILENEKIRQAEDIRRGKKIQNLTNGLVGLMILVAAMILAGLVSTRRKNQKLAESKAQIEKINTDLEAKNREVIIQNEQISQQKDIIEQKNQSITDSIQYASRIQTAVLPPVNFLTDWGIDNFILYRPKDIVSGDFYWGKKKDDMIIVAAADCTGHGVPGAFMSMLGHAFLDEIVNTTVISDAAGILNLLRDEIINTLKQRNMVGEARDGMDISLCIINRENGTIDFAGANNPLYLIRDCKLIKMQADRMPIGIHVSTLVPFTNNRFEIRKGDHIYLFSDGFADQFGGPKGKKFMYKPFQELLIRNHGKTMEEQKAVLENTFINWVGEREQVDDVLVIGMKL